MKLLPEMVVFAKVVDHRGFAAAARHLGMTASAVSRSVARLETHLSVKLLHRTTRSLSLTELGNEVYADCNRIVQAARDVEAQAGRYATRPTGIVRVSAPTVLGELWIARQLPAFFAAWPEVRVDLTLTDQIVDLVDEGLDLAIRVALPDAIAPGLVARMLSTMSYVIVAAPSYLRARGTPRIPEQLEDHRCIYLGYAAFRDRIDMSRDGTVSSVRISGPLTINSSIGILTTVESGLGIGVVPQFAAAAALQAGGLVRLFPDWTLTGAYADRTIHALYAPTRYLPKKVRVLIDHLVAAKDTDPTLP